ncbi:MAG: hypothetical protein WA803_08340 [Steroidobacteraceae bacterium]
MAAQKDRPPLQSAAAAGLCANLAPLVVALGVLSVFADSRPNTLPHAGILHALFGLLAWLYLVARFYERLRRSPPMLPSDLYAFSRRLSRLVYALLYALMFVRLIIDRWYAAPDRPIPSSFEDFQGYLAAGVVAILTIHALSAVCRHFVLQAAGEPADAFSETGG